MYKVFFNERIVFIEDSFKKSLIKGRDCCVFDNESDVSMMWTMFLTDERKRDLYIVHHNIEFLKNIFFSLFKIMAAAGGIVTNAQGALLCIYRWGRWDLPKGKVEKGESFEAAALREVEEECGITNLQIVSGPRVTYHIYESPKKEGRYILKPTYWYCMYYNGTSEPTAQQSEDIEQALWLNGEALLYAKESTYASLKELFDVD